MTEPEKAPEKPRVIPTVPTQDRERLSQDPISEPHFQPPSIQSTVSPSITKDE